MTSSQEHCFTTPIIQIYLIWDFKNTYIRIQGWIIPCIAVRSAWGTKPFHLQITEFKPTAWYGKIYFKKVLTFGSVVNEGSLYLHSEVIINQGAYLLLMTISLFWKNKKTNKKQKLNLLSTFSFDCKCMCLYLIFRTLLLWERLVTFSLMSEHGRVVSQNA